VVLMDKSNWFAYFRHNRRRFISIAAMPMIASESFPDVAETTENVLGPRSGYSPQIGTLVSEMIWMRGAVLQALKGVTQDQLDFLLDGKANRIGALLLHLAAPRNCIS
jgi:hypothetical protein